MVKELRVMIRHSQNQATAGKIKFASQYAYIRNAKLNTEREKKNNILPGSPSCPPQTLYHAHEHQYLPCI